VGYGKKQKSSVGGNSFENGILYLSSRKTFLFNKVMLLLELLKKTKLFFNCLCYIDDREHHVINIDSGFANKKTSSGDVFGIRRAQECV
jgi:hypothetical protein